MKIFRDDGSYILKKEVSFDNLDVYDEEKIIKAKEILGDLINKTVVDDFSFLKDMMRLDGNLKDAYNHFHNSKCYNCCTSLAKSLKIKLEKVLGKTYYVTCKSSGFSTFGGDELIKEAHTFLMYPCLKDNLITFVLFDAGFRNFEPIVFYDKKDSLLYSYESGICKVIYDGLDDYPYSLSLNKVMKRNFKVVDTNIVLKFDPYYETLLILDYDKDCFRAKHSYKIMDYANEVCIGLNIVNGEITMHSKLGDEKYLLDDLLGCVEIKNILKPYFEEMGRKEEIDSFIEVLRFVPVFRDSGILYDKVIEDVITNNY